MDKSKRPTRRTSRAVLLSALLHVGLVVFLLLATLSCATWEHAIGALGLPDSWNPVTCNKPLSLSGPVIEATLLGPSGAPLPPPAKYKAPKPAVPPPTPSKPVVPQKKPKIEPVKTLPPPPKQQDVKDQEKVVAEAQQKAEQAKREQKEREKQRMSELEAQRQREKIDKIFKQLDAAKAQSRKAEQQSKLDKQKLQQLKDLKKSKAPPGPPDVPPAKQAQSGTNGTDNDDYKAAIQNAVTQNWLRPDNIPAGLVCKIDIVQIPGGQVISANVESSCPFDQAGRRSVEDAVMRAQPLPYKGFEKQFRRKVTLNFKVEN